mmetsp:Transcript_7128/g.7821  ORF Transcript_7128/g.7821 Transcript_7128/m.7821 type:complete len:359 (+) Transcript_7128:45-1121(+)
MGNSHDKEKTSKRTKNKRKDSKAQQPDGYTSFTKGIDVSRIDHEITDDINKYYDVTGSVLGVGNFSQVKLGKHKKSGKQFAIKIVDKTLVKNKPEMLKNEVEILLKVDHPNIIRLFDLFDNAKNLFLVMELVSGGELFDKIVEREQYNESDAKKVMHELFSALEYLHKKGIVHRDLKPENLLLLNDKEDSPIKLADFGLSRVYTEEMLMSTACGTPGYVAPEILNAEGYDKEVDMWSTGVIMYILLCGYPPFYSENEAELFENIMSGKFEYHSPYWDEISDEAKDLLNHLLVVDPQKRLNATQALSHAWVEAVAKKEKAKGGKINNTEFKSKLKRHNTQRKEKNAKGRGEVRTVAVKK